MEENNNVGSLQSTVNRLVAIVYEGSSTNDSIFMVSKMTRNQEERIKVLENRVNGILNDDRKSRNQIFWLVLMVLLLGLARFLNIDINWLKSLTGI